MSITTAPDAGDLAVDAHREPAREHVTHVPGPRLLGRQLALEDGLAALDDVLVDRDEHARHLGQHVVEPAADVLLARAAVDGAQRGVDAHEPELGVDQRETYRRALTDDIEQRAGLARRHSPADLNNIRASCIAAAAHEQPERHADVVRQT